MLLYGIAATYNATTIQDIAFFQEINDIVVNL